MRDPKNWNEKQREVDQWLSALGHPERGPLFLYIVGTNGKGSTGRALARSLGDLTGQKVGHFLSPHIHKYNERIMMGNRPINDKHLEMIQDQLDRVEQERNLPSLSYFIHSFVEAMVAFKDLKIAVIEAGIGALEDVTNILPFEAVLLTTMSLDHTNVLGNRLEDIAFQKASAVIPGKTLLSTNQTPEAREVIEDLARKAGSPVLFFDPAWVKKAKVELRQEGETGENLKKGGQADESDSTLWTMTFDYDHGWLSGSYRSCMVGLHQVQNMGSVLSAMEVLMDPDRKEFANLHALFLSKERDWIKKTISQSLSKVYLPGRLELLSRDPFILIDGAHNDQAISLLMDNLTWLGLTKGGKWGAPALIYGTHDDKVSEEKREEIFSFVDATYPVDVEEVSDEDRVREVGEAIVQSLADNPHRPILVAGSLYLLDGASHYLAEKREK